MGKLDTSGAFDPRTAEYVIEEQQSGVFWLLRETSAKAAFQTQLLGVFETAEEAREEVLALRNDPHREPNLKQSEVLFEDWLTRWTPDVRV
jgi:hypothetical protein